MNTRRDFFISFNSADRSRAEWIAHHLRSAGFSVFYQHADWRAGHSFIIKMHEAISLADRVIAVLSQNYLNSAYTQLEWTAALAKDPTGAERRLILIRVGPCELTGLLRPLVFVDLVGLPDDQARKVLLEAIVDSNDNENTHPFGLVRSTDAVGIAAIVRVTRERVCPVLVRRYGRIHGLEPDRPMELQPIYTDVYIFEKIPRNERKTIAEIIGEAEQRGTGSRFAGGDPRLRRIPAMNVIERFPRLMILGGPGSGKTTLLRRLVLLCASGQYRGDTVPLFVECRDLGDSLLMDLVKSELGSHVQELLAHGRVHLFLDGLDELPTQNAFSRVRREIEFLSSTYPDCPVVVTCRVAAKEYVFSDLTEVELAPFEQEQQRQFAHNWFVARGKPQLASHFTTELTRVEGLAGMSRTPLMLSLLCLVYEQKKDFGDGRAELYEEAADVLLRRWDKRRDVARQRQFSQLTRKRVLTILGRIALKYFELGQYLIHRDDLEADIVSFFGDETEADGISLIAAIEAENGLLVERAHNIYSFAHRTFQEYFAARALALRANSSHDEVLAHCGDRRWLEVILLYCAMQKPTADRFVVEMKHALDDAIASSGELQNILRWLQSRGEYPDQIITDSTRRALDLTFVLTSARARDYAQWERFSHSFVESVDRLFGERRLDGGEYDGTLDLVLMDDFDGLLLSGHTPTFDIALKDLLGDDIIEKSMSLQDLRDALESYLEEDAGRQPNGVERLRQILIEHRNIGHSWSTVTADEFGMLHRYYEGHVCLLKCLETASTISDSTTRQIYETLLLPVGTTSDNAVS